MKILVVEDNKETREFLESSLTEEGFAVDVAENGLIASKKAEIDRYDLIILDSNLPFKGGRQICSEIRSRGSSVPIIMLSVKSEVQEKVRLFEVGVDDYLTKPFSFVELMARIKALLKRAKIIEREVIQIEDLILDTVGRSVTRGSKMIHLSCKEYILLEYLLRNRGRVVSKVEIVKHIWDMEAPLSASAIRMHVVNLRKKIDDKGGLVQTVVGVGYKIV